MPTTSFSDSDGQALVPLVETPEHTELRAAVSKIVARFGRENYAKAAAVGAPVKALWEVLSQHGFLGIAIPEQYGGGGAGLTELAIVLEELSAGGCPDMALVVSVGITGAVLSLHGTSAQKQKYLPSIADGSERFSFALTEADAGSNSHNVTTSARRAGDEWVISGSKQFISGADECDHLLLVARTGTDETDGRGRLTLFVVDVPTPGLSYQHIPTAVKAPDRQFTLFLDEVRVPAENVIGPVDHGLRLLFDGLNPERVLSAVISTGIARYALAKACGYARERTVWQVPIGAHQAVQHPLAEAAIQLEAARLMTWRAAALFDHGLPAGEVANMAKYLASEVGMNALDTAIQVHGGNGLADEFGLVDLWGIARLQQIGPVSSQMILNFVGQHTLGLPKSY